MTEVTAFARLPIDSGVIPNNVIVPCPKKGTIHKMQVQRYATTCCPDCEFFRGLARLQWGSTEEDEIKIQDNLVNGITQWSDVYAVRCATIYEIPCQTIDEREY